MPKKLKIWPNERLDIPDFERAANDFTAETDSFIKEKLILDRRSRVVDGFRVQLDSSPGQITIFNGNAINRDGEHLTEEALAAASLTVTLTGASTTFYVELERVESDSDSDARAFWDPTYDNGGAPTPDGKEFSLPVATRKTPTWRVVTPISTTGFEVDSDPTSTKIPLVVLVTDASNEITNAVNPGLSLVQPSTVSELSLDIGDSSVRVFDSRNFAIGDVIDIHADDASVESVTITAIDYDNHIIEFAPVTAAAHDYGIIIRRTSGSANLIEERTNPNDASDHPEAAKRLWQGDETRGTALVQSKEDADLRDDLNLRSLKDYMDFMAAQLRELKFGNPIVGENDTAPPGSFSSTRYFDSAGGVAAGRIATITIGDGSSSWGDFNGTDETPFESAKNYIHSRGGGLIFVKKGTYTFSNRVNFTTSVTIVGESREEVRLIKGNTTALFQFSGSGSDKQVGIKDITLVADNTTAPDAIVALVALSTGAAFNMENVFVEDGEVQLVSGAFVIVNIDKCSFSSDFGSGTDHCLSVLSGALGSISINDSTLLTFAVGDGGGPILFETGSINSKLHISNSYIAGSFPIDCELSLIQEIRIRDCVISGETGAFYLAGSAVTVTISGSHIDCDGLASNMNMILIDTATKVSISECYLEGTGTGGTALTNAPSLINITGPVVDLTVDSTHMEWDDPANEAVGIRFSSATTTNAVVSNSMLRLLSCGIISNSSAVSVLSVTGSVIDGGSMLGAQYGILMQTSSIETSVLCSGLKVTGLSSAGVTVSGIHITSNNICHVALTGCYVVDVQATANSAYGLYVASGVAAHEVLITGTYFYNLEGADDAMAVRTTGAAGACTQVVGDCFVERVAADGGDAAAIFISSGFATNISNVSVWNVTSTSGNAYSLRSSGLMEDSSVVGLCGGPGIRIAQGTRLSIKNNSVEVGTGYNYGIHVLYTDGAETITVSNNIIDCSSAATAAIAVSPDGLGDAVKNLSICDNTIHGLDGIGVLVDGAGTGVRIDNNSIKEELAKVGNVAIYAHGTSSASADRIVGLSVCGNIIECVEDSAAITHTIGAIDIQYSSRFAVNNNIVHWGNSGGTVLGSGIIIDTVNSGTVAGNQVQATGSAIEDIVITNAVSAMVGDNAVDAGIISLNGTAYTVGGASVAVSNLFGYNLV